MSVKYRLRMYCVIALFLAALVAINLAAARIEDGRGLKIDLSANQLTKLSDETEQALAALKQEVYVYTLYREGTKSDLRTNTETLLEQYRAKNPLLHAEGIDPQAEPGRVLNLVSDASALTEGSIIVTDADAARVKVIYAGDMFSYQLDQSTGSYKISSFVGESKLTSAILYVAAKDVPRVFFLSGHGEIALGYCTVAQAQLQSRNYEVSEITLADKKLEPNDALVVLSPKTDLDDGEYTLIRDWLEAGGRLMYISDPLSDAGKLKNFERLLSYYDLGFEDGVVIADVSATGEYISSQICLIPETNKENAVTKDIAGRLALVQTGAVAKRDMPLAGYVYADLLTSSDRSYLKSAKSMDALFTPLPDDPKGPFSLSVSALRENADDPSKDTRIVLGCTPYLAVDSNYLNSSYNLEFFAGAIDWLVNKTEAITVRAKPIASTALVLPDAATFWRLSGIVALLIPAIFLILGGIVWLKRKNL